MTAIPAPDVVAHAIRNAPTIEEATKLVIAEREALTATLDVRNVRALEAIAGVLKGIEQSIDSALEEMPR